MGYDLPQLRRLRIWIRAAVLAGITSSVVLNVLHAPANPIARSISALPPLFFVASLELISRIPSSNKALSFGRILGSLTIASIGGYISYMAQIHAVRRYGIDGVQADLWPIIIDGFMLVTTLSLIEVDRKLRQTGPAPKPVSPDLLALEAQAQEYRQAAAKLKPYHAVDVAGSRRNSLGESRRISEKNSEKLGESV